MQHERVVYTLKPGDALLVINVQQDFLLHGSLAVPDGNAVIPVFATRDWHPPTAPSAKPPKAKQPGAERH